MDAEKVLKGFSVAISSVCAPDDLAPLDKLSRWARVQPLIDLSRESKDRAAGARAQPVNG